MSEPFIDSFYPFDTRRLAASWKLVNVGDVVNQIQSGFASGIHNQGGTGIPHYRPMNISRNGTIDVGQVKYVSPDKGAHRLRVGDVLFNNTNSPVLVGKTAYIAVDGDIAYSNHMTRLRPPDEMDPRFVAYQLHSLYAQGYFLQKCVKHVNQASISATTLAQTVPLIVPPLPEQRRIVAEIEKQFTRLDAAVESLKRAQANLKRHRASVLKAACEGKLVPTEAELAHNEGRHYEPADVLLERILKERRARWEADELAKMRARGREPKDDKWRAKYKEPNAPDTSDLPELPEGWVWSTMPSIGELNRGKSKHRPRNAPELYGGPYPFVQTGDVRHSQEWIKSHSQTYSEVGLAQSRLWPSMTLCITIAANICETGILTYPACFPDSVVGFICEEDEIIVRFTEIYLRTQKDRVEGLAPATAQKNINLDILSKIGVSLPPLAEQHRIVTEVERQLSVIQASEEIVEANLKRAERLRQSILKKAFEGKLVPQDPTDEPASVLLERIKAEREQMATARTSRTRSRS